MKRTLVLLALSALACPALAKPKERVFNTSCDTLWAAVKTATAPPHYNFAQLDDATHKGIVSTGNSLTGKRYLDLSLTGSGDTCTLAVGGVYSGIIHNDKGDLFGRVDEALQPPAGAQSSASAVSSAAGSAPAEAASGKTTGTVK